jgi:hypothetical protein
MGFNRKSSSLFRRQATLDKTDPLEEKTKMRLDGVIVVA